MKKLLILIVTIACTASLTHAQKLNQDTLAKYSKKSEQIRVFNKVAADIHLDAVHSARFNTLSAAFTDKAIAIIKNGKTSRCDKFDLLKQTLNEYTVQIKQVLSPQQFAMLKSERDKYHFARRFVILND